MSNAKSTIGLFGVRSPLAVEYEESCHRLNITIEFAISVSGTPRVFATPNIVDLADVSSVSTKTKILACAFSPTRRKELLDQAEELGFEAAPPLVDPHAVIARTVRIEDGTFINTGTVIGAVSIIGYGVLINRSASLGHHTVLGDYVSIGPGATLAGNIRVGENTVIGAGAVIQPNVNIGENVIIAAGTVIRKNISDNTLVAGNPAIVRKFKPSVTSLNVDGEE
jgi:sugar O-acyltransferase (sialic acid O-acetyltransferase NeuD family)